MSVRICVAETGETESDGQWQCVAITPYDGYKVLATVPDCNSKEIYEFKRGGQCSRLSTRQGSVAPRDCPATLGGHIRLRRKSQDKKRAYGPH